MVLDPYLHYVAEELNHLFQWQISKGLIGKLHFDIILTRFHKLNALLTCLLLFTHLTIRCWCRRVSPWLEVIMEMMGFGRKLEQKSTKMLRNFLKWLQRHMLYFQILPRSQIHCYNSLFLSCIILLSDKLSRVSAFYYHHFYSLCFCFQILCKKFLVLLAKCC